MTLQPLRQGITPIGSITSTYGTTVDVEIADHADDSGITTTVRLAHTADADESIQLTGSEALELGIKLVEAGREVVEFERDQR